AAAGGYLIGYGIRHVPGLGTFVNLAAQGGSGIIIRNFFPPDTVKFGKLGEAIQKLCADVPLGSEGCLRRLEDGCILQVLHLSPPRPHTALAATPLATPPYSYTPNYLPPYTTLSKKNPAPPTPAVKVTITQQLDSGLDWGTFELGSFGFRDRRFDVPAGRRF